MHRPPAVAWKTGQSRWQGQVFVGLWLCSALSVGGFLVTQTWGVAAVALLAVLFASTILAGRALNKPNVGQLRWDGEQWHWSGVDDYAVTAIACVLDLQRLLLLHVRCEQGPDLWLWLEASNNHIGWQSLRRAVMAVARAVEPGGDALQEPPQPGL